MTNLSASDQFIKSYVRNGPMIWYDYNFDSTPLWEGVVINMDMFAHIWGQVFRDIDITKGLDKLDHPVFLALGRYDFIVAPPASWEPIKPKFKDLTLRVFEKSGHTPQFEDPVLFDSELTSWLEKHK
jgi:proline iminopeptidase